MLATVPMPGARMTKQTCRAAPKLRYNGSNRGTGEIDGLQETVELKKAISAMALDMI
jgi:hypothetical protein